MNYEKLYKDIQSICKVVTKHHDLCDDLVQEVMLIALSLDDIEDRYYTEKKRTLNFLLGIAYKQWNWQGSPFNRTHNNTFFDCNEKVWKRWNTEEIEDYKQALNISSDVDIVELINDLTEIERLWLHEWSIRNFSKKKLSEDAGISRPSINKALNEIFNKIRSN